MMYTAKFEIFRGHLEKGPLWVDAVEGVGRAMERMRELAAATHGPYFILYLPTGEVIASADGSNGGTPLKEGATAPCCACGSSNQQRFTSEIVIHSLRLRNANKFPVLVLPALLHCLDCGKAEFVVTESELALLVKMPELEAPNPIGYQHYGN